ncbi:outer membrane beta-barrel protein [Apibacter sp. B3889]|uniref:outer membrane beta-barrel protein n=1 Tax=unclassified Apibacter TaxID=2630820 RepID=UPI00132A4BC0|nr:MULTISPECIES: outer membrane beta-barrel protein [unclassified Apibacter]MXO34919.1 outer membrane beta-barrel protein [Apibacter sp. B3883]MXO41976.1 outer membrane beta-barrel protein [Apibacter sp. B3889]MXP03546.1 outer membrane beta-barrel protein [Apibacter sp. B3887]MXP08217.1 outer membrane beta-barrel protein [Apibacter sp. B3935]
MKRLFPILFLLFISIVTYAQQVEFGAKAGMAFGYKGTLKQTVTNIKESKATDNIGWHAGFFSRIKFLEWFIQPEIYFSSMKTNFDYRNDGEFTAHSNRLDIPILFGSKFLEVTRLYAGPVFSTSLNEDISLKGIRKTKTDDFSLAGQVGGGFDLAKLTFDVRYEFGFNKNQTNFIKKRTGEAFKLEKRQNSLVLSVGYKF